MGKIKLVRDKHIISKVVETIDETSIGSREELVTSQAILNLKNDIIEIVDGDSPISNLNERYKYELENLEHYLDFAASLRVNISDEYSPNDINYLPSKISIPNYENEAFIYTGTYITADSNSALFLQIEITDERYMFINIYDKTKKLKCTLKGIIDVEGNFNTSCIDEDIYNEDEIFYSEIQYKIYGNINIDNNIMNCSIEKKLSDNTDDIFSNITLDLHACMSKINSNDDNFTTMLHNPNNLLNGIVYKVDGDKIIFINNNYETISLDIGNNTVTTKITDAKINGGRTNIIGLKENGTVVAAGNNDYGQCNVSSWTNIDKIFNNDGLHTIGITLDGNVLSTGNNDYGQCNVTSWSDIKDIKTDFYHTMGLFNNGTVRVVGANFHGETLTSSWTDIIAIDICYHNSVGLRSNGTVIAIGNNWYNQCDTSSWTNVVDVKCGAYYVLGLRSDGTCLITGYTKRATLDVSNWIDVKTIKKQVLFCVGLTNSNTVFATGTNDYGQCNVSSWTDIVDVSLGLYHTVGLKSDGTVVATGRNDNGECNVSSWTDIISISTSNYATIGLKSDGTVVVSGLMSSTEDWDLIGILEKDIKIVIDDDGNYLGDLELSNINFKIITEDNLTSGVFKDLTNNINYYTKNVLPPKILNEELEELINKINNNKNLIEYYLNNTNNIFNIDITLGGNYDTYYPVWFKFKKDFSNDIIIENFTNGNKYLYCHIVGYGNNNSSHNHSYIKHLSDNDEYIQLLSSKLIYKPSPTIINQIPDHFGFYLRGNTTYKFTSTNEDIITEITNNLGLGQVTNITFTYLAEEHIIQPLSEDDLNYIERSKEFRFANSIERII
jgi:alpha-tubulin suppressor-like RCC1 family protein